MKKMQLLAFSLFSISIFAQQSHTGFVSSPPKFHKHFAPSAAFSYSVINNRKEVRGQYKPGINVGLSYVTHPWFAWSAEYSWFFKHNSSPGFENINAWNTELNGNLLMGMANSDLKFRFLFGMNYMKWSGTFVGPSLNDNQGWYVGKTINQDWVGGNMGVGFDHHFGNYFEGYIDFRIRFASEKRDLISISDTAFNFGLKWSPPNTFVKVDKNGKPQKKKNSSQGSSRIYKWLKRRTT
jgi:hypothetical protein